MLFKDGGRVGNLCSQRQVFPIHSAMASLLNKGAGVSRTNPIAWARLIAEMVELVSSTSPPNITVTIENELP